MNNAQNQNFPYVPQSPVVRLGRSFMAGIKATPRRVAMRVKGLFAGISSRVRDFFGHFAEGDGITRGSYLILGLGHLCRGQIARGILYLLLQALFILYMVAFGGRYLGMFLENLLTGGNVGRVETHVSDVWNEELGEYVKVAGDNSFHIVLYGILSVFVILFFLLTYLRSVREAYGLEQAAIIGRRPDGLRRDLTLLGDSKFHVTLLSLPLAGLFVFTVVPLVTMILIAFTNYDANHEVPEHLFQWVGFQNFRDMLSGGSSLGATFRRVLTWTLTWAFFSTFSNYFVGMLLALLINKKGIRLKKFYRTLFVATIAVPQFVSLLIMSKMLDTGGGVFGSGGGIITQLIENLFGYHLQFGLDILTTRICIILVNLWIGVPFSMLLCSGILMNIPEDLYESARIDGTGPLRRFMKITLPYMLFVTGPYLITQFIGNLNNFNVIFLLSGGGPGDLSLYTNGAKGTDLLITWLYKLSLGADRNYKLASVIGILVFIISAALSLIVYNRSSSVKGEEHFQ
ncbi:MAG: sugar ABC transporter permease [Ruminococcaceae bacterium]|nr:sugar ABC transporter permease [Oscillospiraceae bacterium]